MKFSNWVLLIIQVIPHDCPWMDARWWMTCCAWGRPAHKRNVVGEERLRGEMNGNQPVPVPFGFFQPIHVSLLLLMMGGLWSVVALAPDLIFPVPETLLPPPTFPVAHFSMTWTDWIFYRSSSSPLTSHSNWVSVLWMAELYWVRGCFTKVEYLPYIRLYL